MDFRCIYEHGFARVAACTERDRDRRPGGQRRGGAAPGARVRGGGRRGRRLPRAQPDRLLDRGPAAPGRAARRRRGGARRRSSTGSADLLPVLVVGAPLRHRGRVYNCAVVVHRGRILGVVPEVVPADLPRVLRSAASSPRATTSAARSASAAPTSRSGPTCCSRPRTSPGSCVHVEICEDVWVPIPPSSEAALAGATVLLNLSGSPITVGRAEDRKLMCRSQSSRCLAAYVYAAAGEGESTHRPLLGRPDDDLRERRPARRDASAFPTATAAPSPTSTSTCCARSGCGWARSTTTAATHAERLARLPPDRVHARPPGRRPRPAPRARALPVRARRPRAGSSRTATRPTTSRSPGCSSGSRAIGDPKVVIGVSGGLDSTHALIVAAKAMDRVGRPRTRHPRLHPARLRDERRARRPTPTS